MSTESNQFRYLLDLLHDKEIEEARKDAKTGPTERRTAGARYSTFSECSVRRVRTVNCKIFKNLGTARTAHFERTVRTSNSLNKNFEKFQAGRTPTVQTLVDPGLRNQPNSYPDQYHVIIRHFKWIMTMKMLIQARDLHTRIRAGRTIVVVSRFRGVNLQWKK